MTSVIDGESSWILSPHSDDAALSLAVAIRSGILPGPITIVTVFSSSGFSSSSDLSIESTTQMRLEEDTDFAQIFGVSLVSLGLWDAPLRTSARDVFDSTLRLDGKDISQVSRLVGAIIGDSKDRIVILPAGIGSHIDHRVVAALDQMPFSRVYRYADQPYAIRDPNWIKRHRIAPVWVACASAENVALKMSAAACYPSQPAASRLVEDLQGARNDRVVEALWQAR
jgi:LmbE family N-acetylglucosaminyl deacetylase